jgi:hypothetical protein
MLIDLLTQKFLQKKNRLLILDTPEHVDSEKLNRQKLTDFKTFYGYFHVLQVVEHTRDSFGTNTVKK